MNNYQKLSVEEFGRKLILTHDLDPVYVMIHSADKHGKLTYSDLVNWCVIYWCCYHCGVSTAMTQLTHVGKNIWDMLEDVATNKTMKWPRGTERRHFRGDNATAMVRDLRERYTDAKEFLEHLKAYKSFKGLSAFIQEHTGFGPWIAFKIADMMERVLYTPIDFTSADLMMYDEPMKGARLACEKWCSGSDYENEGYQHFLEYTVKRLSREFRHLKAPPAFDRPINVQEIETILCKWKAHMKGHYPLGKDSREIHHHLRNWGPLADEFAKFVPSTFLQKTLV